MHQNKEDKKHEETLVASKNERHNNRETPSLTHRKEKTKGRIAPRCTERKSETTRLYSTSRRIENKTRQRGRNMEGSASVVTGKCDSLNPWTYSKIRTLKATRNLKVTGYVK